MDEGSDSLKGEPDTFTSGDSLQVLSDLFRLHQLLSTDATSTEQLSQRLETLELDNERLRLDLENTRLELSAKNAANQTLKDKIAELYVEAQTSLQEKQKLRNCVKDTECKLVATEGSLKWYQKQVHQVQASKKSLNIEIDTYQSMLRQKSLTLMNVNAKYKQLNDDYTMIVQKHKQEKNVLQAEIDLVKTATKNNSITTCHMQSQVQSKSTVPMSICKELSSKLELAEEELQQSKAELRSLEQRLRSLDEERAESKAICLKQQIQLTTAEGNLRSYENERSSLMETFQELRIELSKLRFENESLQLALLSSKQEREQVEQAIEHLSLQLTKMIAQHKLLRSRNNDLEAKLSVMRNVCDENKKLKSLSYSTNGSFFRRLRLERRKASNLQKQLCQEQSRHRVLVEQSKTDASLKDSLKQVLEKNRELREQLKSSKISEESVDEGYADGSSVTSLSLINLPSPQPLSPTLLNTINEILVKSKDFWEPIKLGLDEIQIKLDDCKIERINEVPSTCCMPMPPSSPLINA